MADFVICPRCRRQNPADAVFCNRCGVRLLNAGVYYRNRDTSSSVGMGQLLLGLGVLVLAGLVLGGGAILLLGGTPRPTPTHVAGGPTDSIVPTSSTTSPLPSPAPTPTLLVTPSLTFPSSFPPTLSPTPTPSPVPTLPPTPTPEPTPGPTPVDCAVASTGIDVKELVLGFGNPTSRGPIGRVWCIRDVTFHPIFDPGVTTGYGTARLMRGTKVVAQYTCTTISCGDGPFTYVPPKRISAGSTLSYQFACQDSPDTVEDDCTDAIADGMTITIHYEAFAGP